MTFSQQARVASLWHFLLGRPSQKRPFLLQYRSSTVFIVGTICLAIFTDIFLYGLIVPVIPFSLTDRVGTSEENVQKWTAILLACYNGALFVGSPIAGFYADRTHSRRMPLLLGLVALAASTLLLMLGTSITMLVLGRLLQGLSAAVVWSVGLALLADTMGSKIGMAMGYVAIAMSMGLLLSPAIGGAVYEGAGYYPVYYVAFGIIFLDVMLRLILVEKKVAKQWLDTQDTGHRIENQETAPDLIENPDPEIQEKQPGENPVDNANQDASASQPKTPHPYIVFIKSKRALASLYGISVQAGIVMSFDTILPLFVQRTFHWNSTAAGLIFFCLFMPDIISPVVGWMSDRFGPKWLSAFGFIASIPPIVCMRFVTQSSIGHKVLLGALLVFTGVVQSFAYVPLMAEISYIIADKEKKTPGVFGKKGMYGVAYGLLNTFYALGGTVGSLMSGYLVDGKGWPTALWALGIWCATGALAVGLWVGGRLSMRSCRSKHREAADLSLDVDEGIARS